MVNNDFPLLMDELDDLTEKISTCNGPESTKALIAKLNELNNKYNENLIREQKNKFNKTLYDAINTYYKTTGTDSIPIYLQANHDGYSVRYEIIKAFRDGNDIILFYNDEEDN